MPLATSYDDVPYPRLAFPLTHPSHLCAVANLLGMNPAPPQQARVLELGCASGANLIPMAYAAQSASFVGIDLSERQIAAAEHFRAAVGLQNVTLRVLDIREAADALGAGGQRFDYIIAHGIYSWVPDDVKDAMLDATRRLLAPDGIAYVSYNSYPGCQARDMLRQMTQYAARKAENSRDYAAAARGFLELLQQAMPQDDSAYRAICRQQVGELLSVPQEILLHDDLEGDNDPRYYHQFMAHAGRHGLGYVGDAYFGQMFGLGADPQALEKIRQAGDRQTFEQYLDFLFGRSLRTTLLCHADKTPSGEISVAGIDRLCVSTEAQPREAKGQSLPANQIPVADESAVTFVAPECTVSLTTRLAKAALRTLVAAAPRPIAYLQLRDAVADLLKVSAQHVDRDLRALVVEWFATRLAELHGFAPPIATAAGERPIASAVARYQAAQGWSLTNLLHRRIRLSGDLTRDLIGWLDGEHSRRQLLERIRPRALATLAPSDRPTDPKKLDAVLTKQLEDCLRDLAHHALLVSG